MAAKTEKRKAEKMLEELGKKIVEDIKKSENPNMSVPIRALSNVHFDEEKKSLVLGSSAANRYFFNVGHIKKFVQTLAVASIGKELLSINKHSSLRDVFYMAKRTIPNSKINVVDEQIESDKAIEDLEVLLDVSREELNINANKAGSVSGDVVIEDSGDTIDWSKMGSGGWSIPSNVEDIKFKSVKAKYVVYMEKAAVWERLHEDKFWKKHDCIIMASQGQTTRGIRRLLWRLSKEYNLPIYILADFDPWGFYIYSVLKYGSINLAHISEKMVLPNCKFLGITADDIDNYGLKKHFIKLKEVDMSRLRQISDYGWFQKNKVWQRQFTMMKSFGAKAEIQALSSRGISFITDKYLPEKIAKKDFIE
jgi:DNA topoisomerase VI subunit A